MGNSSSSRKVTDMSLSDITAAKEAVESQQQDVEAERRRKLQRKKMTAAELEEEAREAEQRERAREEASKRQAERDRAFSVKAQLLRAAQEARQRTLPTGECLHVVDVADVLAVSLAGCSGGKHPTVRAGTDVAAPLGQGLVDPRRAVARGELSFGGESNGDAALRRAASLSVVNLGTGGCMRVLRGHTAQVNGARVFGAVDCGPGRAVPRDDRRVLSWSDDASLRLWEMSSGECLWVLAGHSASITSAAIVAVGTDAGPGAAGAAFAQVISASRDQTLRVWDIGHQSCRLVLRGHAGDVLDVAATKDAACAVSGSTDKTARVWSVESGEMLHVLMGHTNAVTHVAVTRDSSRAATASEDTTLRVWDILSGACVHELRGHEFDVLGVAVAPSGACAVSRSTDHVLRVWDLEHGTCTHVLSELSGRPGVVAITPDGRRVFCGASDSGVRIWDLDTGTALRQLIGHTGAIVGGVVTGDGSTAVTWSHTEVRFWQLLSPAEIDARRRVEEAAAKAKQEKSALRRARRSVAHFLASDVLALGEERETAGAASALRGVGIEIVHDVLELDFDGPSSGRATIAAAIDVVSRAVDLSDVARRAIHDAFCGERDEVLPYLPSEVPLDPDSPVAVCVERARISRGRSATALSEHAGISVVADTTILVSGQEFDAVEEIVCEHGVLSEFEGRRLRNLLARAAASMRQNSGASVVVGTAGDASIESFLGGPVARLTGNALAAVAGALSRKGIVTLQQLRKCGARAATIAWEIVADAGTAIPMFARLRFMSAVASEVAAALPPAGEQRDFDFAAGTYTGALADGLPDGHGTLVSADGEVYVGNFRCGLRHGRGVHAAGDGARYDGEWLCNLRHGEGAQTRVGGPFESGRWLVDVLRTVTEFSSDEARLRAECRARAAAFEEAAERFAAERAAIAESCGEKAAAAHPKPPLLETLQGEAEAVQAKVAAMDAKVRALELASTPVVGFFHRHVPALLGQADAIAAGLADLGINSVLDLLALDADDESPTSLRAAIEAGRHVMSVDARAQLFDVVGKIRAEVLPALPIEGPLDKAEPIEACLARARVADCTASKDVLRRLLGLASVLDVQELRNDHDVAAAVACIVNEHAVSAFEAARLGTVCRTIVAARDDGGRDSVSVVPLDASATVADWARSPEVRMEPPAAELLAVAMRARGVERVGDARDRGAAALTAAYDALVQLDARVPIFAKPRFMRAVAREASRHSHAAGTSEPAKERFEFAGGVYVGDVAAVAAAAGIALPDGAGVLTFANGDRYSGGWSAGLHHGRGTFTRVDGSRYDGEWLCGNHHGEGYRTHAGGDFEVGRWFAGALVEATRFATDVDAARCEARARTAALRAALRSVRGGSESGDDDSDVDDDVLDVDALPSDAVELIAQLKNDAAKAAAARDAAEAARAQAEANARAAMEARGAAEKARAKAARRAAKAKAREDAAKPAASGGGAGGAGGGAAATASVEGPAEKPKSKKEEKAARKAAEKKAKQEAKKRAHEEKRKAKKLAKQREKKMKRAAYDRAKKAD